MENKAKLNKTWGYGQLFGFSGLEGPNRYYEDFILMLMKSRLEFRVEYQGTFLKISFPTEKKVECTAVMSDFVSADIGGDKFTIAFADADTLVGISPIPPNFKGKGLLISMKSHGVDVKYLSGHFLGVRCEKTNEGYRFAIHNSNTLSGAVAGANFYFESIDPQEVVDKYVAYYEAMPTCRDEKYEELYYKCLSVNKVNVHSPEGKITRLWTTPDRVPHRHMWMWDSAFHAIAMSEYNHQAAQEIFLAMLEQARPDGFIPHMANPTDRTDITQPCVMSWAAYHVYEKTHDKDFLRTCLPYLENYLKYDLEHRDENHNLLLEWATDPDDKKCKCGESGLDNSPRFDFDQKMDCIDFSSYLALDTKALAKICHILGEEELAKKYEQLHQQVADAINSLMWDEEDGVYYDRLFNGQLTKVLTPSSFLPMLAGISSKAQAERMKEKLLDSSELMTAFPFASISKKHPEYSTDMWRGGTWLNIDYFLLLGLRNYGYEKEADTLRDTILEKVGKWHLKTGCVFEFYDPDDKVSPFHCDRKGKQPKNPDYRKHVHSIADFNWSACFTMLLIQKVYLSD